MQNKQMPYKPLEMLNLYIFKNNKEQIEILSFLTFGDKLWFLK